MTQKIRVGLVGYGKAGKAVANILSTDQRFDLCWIARRSASAERQTHPDTDIPIISITQQSFDELFDQHPVDAVVDFSTPETLRAYGEAVRKRGIMLVSAISAYSDDDHAQRHFGEMQIIEKSIVAHFVFQSVWMQ